jgi:NPCBM/NEW2 domain
MAGGSPPPPQRTSGRTAWLSRPAWTGIGSLVGILALAVALGAWWLPQSAESSTSQSTGPNAPQPADTSTAHGTDAVMPPSTMDSAAPATTEAAPAGQTYLYELPATSAGRPGPQRSPIDVQLAGNRYAHSTGMWTQCAGAAAPQVTFYTGQKYQHLAGTLGVDSSAPDGMSVQVLVYADDGVWQWFNVAKDASLPIDLDISRYKKIGLTSSSPGGCPAGKQLVHLGDGVVF